MLEVTNRSLFFSQVDFNPDAYVVGPMDYAHLNECERSCTDDRGISFGYLVYIPRAFSQVLLDHPDFWETVEWGYLNCDEKPITSPLVLVNWMTKVASEVFLDMTPGIDPYVYTAAFMVGWLAGVAEYDSTLAFVGLSHLCFLLALLPLRGAMRTVYAALHDIDHRQKAVLTAYRSRLRALTSEGVALREAYRQAYSTL
jgi:hypothetical protein